MFLIDGFPRNFDNFNGWNREMGGLVEIPATIFLDCKKEDIIDRIKQRSNKESRVDDKIETVEKRIVSFEKETIPVIEELSKTTNIIKLNGCGNPKIINEKLIRCLRYLI